MGWGRASKAVLPAGAVVDLSVLPFGEAPVRHVHRCFGHRCEANIAQAGCYDRVEGAGIVWLTACCEVAKHTETVAAIARFVEQDYRADLCAWMAVRSWPIGGAWEHVQFRSWVGIWTLHNGLEVARVACMLPPGDGVPLMRWQRPQTRQHPA